jgi:hypothetical protein
VLILLLIDVAHAELPGAHAPFQGGSSFDYPTSYASCFYQGEWSGNLQKFWFTYSIIVAPEDTAKYAKLFLAFRYNPINRVSTELDEWWFYGDPNSAPNRYPSPTWIKFDPKSDVPTPYVNTSVRLTALLRVSTKIEDTVFDPLLGVAVTKVKNTVDINAFLKGGRAELIFGYGFDEPRGKTDAEIFQEMLAHKRYSTIVNIGQLQDHHGYTGLLGTEICQYYNRLTLTSFT